MMRTMYTFEKPKPDGRDPNDRRRYSRLKVSVPILIQPDGVTVPIRATTSDLSLGGCYVETIFPLPRGTTLDVQLFIGHTILVSARVVACDPQVGNGITFMKMLPEDQEALNAFIEAAAKASAESKAELPPAQVKP